MALLQKIAENNMTKADYNVETVNFLEDTVEINKNIPMSWMNITLFLLTGMLVIVVNMIVLLSVKVKDTVLIDKMVILDCVANIMIVGVLLLAFPRRVWNNSFLCAGITFFRVFTVTINK